jgi:hypothetical protein
MLSRLLSPVRYCQTTAWLNFYHQIILVIVNIVNNACINTFCLTPADRLSVLNYFLILFANSPIAFNPRTFSYRGDAHINVVGQEGYQFGDPFNDKYFSLSDPLTRCCHLEPYLFIICAENASNSETSC